MKPRDERREAARAALIADPARSDRWISKETGFNRESVTYLRRDLVAAGLIPACPVKGLDGKVYHFHRKDRPPGRANEYIKRIRGLIDCLASPRYAVAWRNTRPKTRARLAREIERLHRVLKNAQAGCEKPKPSHGLPIRVYRTGRAS